jgi:hypothetical protein
VAALNTQSQRLVANWTCNYDSQAFTNSDEIVGTPAQLTKLLVSNSKDAALYIFLFDNTSATGTPKIAPLIIPAATTLLFDFATLFGNRGLDGILFTTGIYWAASTSATFDADSSDSTWVTARYIA